MLLNYINYYVPILKLLMNYTNYYFELNHEDYIFVSLKQDKYRHLYKEKAILYAFIVTAKAST